MSFKRVPIQLRVPIISDKQYCCPYEEPFGYIYLVTNKVNGHMYVGKHEWHKPSIDMSYWGSGVRLIKAYNSPKYDKNKDFEITIIQWINSGVGSLEELNAAEVFWIDIFGTFKFPFHYNSTEGGEGTSGCKPSQETIKLWKEQRTGSGNPMYGKHHSDEQKEKWSLDRKGKMSGESHPMYGVHRCGESAPMYGKHHSEESKAKNRESHLGKLAGRNNPNYGGKYSSSEEVRRKIREKNLGKKMSDNAKFLIRVRLGTPIVQLDLYGAYINRYNSVSEPSSVLHDNNTKFNRHKISDCCKHKIESYKGYKWMYESEYIELGGII